LRGVGVSQSAASSVVSMAEAPPATVNVVSMAEALPAAANHVTHVESRQGERSSPAAVGSTIRPTTR